MNFFSNEAFRMAEGQFHRIADFLAIPDDHRNGLLMPWRCHVATLPLRRDDGSWAHFQSCRVQHQWLRGPAKGGTRFAPDLDLGEAAALAIWMSWKCALMGLPFGGAKGGVAVDPGQLSSAELERLTRAYVDAMAPMIGVDVDVMAPDIGTDEITMGWMADAYAARAGHWVPGIVTGKPIALDGIEGRREATGFGVARLAERALVDAGGKIEGARVIVQGFGNVGAVAAEFLAARGARIVGVADQFGAYYDPQGLDLDALLRYARHHRGLDGFSAYARIGPREMLTQTCEILIPAARECAIDAGVAAQLRCRVIAEGANGPVTLEADEILGHRSEEIFVVPDILCNAGGVTASHSEWVQNCRMQRWSREDVLRRVGEVLNGAYETVVARARRDGISMRFAANAIAVERVYWAHQHRGSLSRH